MTAVSRTHSHGRRGSVARMGVSSLNLAGALTGVGRLFM